MVERELLPGGGTLTVQNSEYISTSFVDVFEGSSKRQLVKGACVR